MLSATWDEAAGVWRIETDCDDHISAKFLICGNGPLSTPRLPDVEGQDSFVGLSMHTSQWQGDDVDPVRGKRVAVIGTGASGAQVSPEIAKVAEHLYETQDLPSVDVPTPYHSSWLDNDKAKFLLDWEPKYDLKRLIDEAWNYKRSPDEPRKIWYPG